jgi:AcrR family transcriptional regulator
MEGVTTPRPKARTRNRRGEGGLLRDEIVGAAERLLEREGDEEAITLRSVAREAGISAPSIYAHFADREAIIDAVLDLAFARLLQIITTATDGVDDPPESLLTGCRAYVRFGAEEPARYKVLFNRTRVPAAPATSHEQDVWAERLKAFQTLVDGVTRCVEAGVSDSTDPFADAVAIWTAMHGTVMLRQFAPGFPWPDPAASFDETVRRLARLR